MIKNEQGLACIRHWTSNPSQYTQSQHNVSLGWVEEDKLPQILAERVRSCCGKTRLKYHLANENDVSIFATGHLP